MFSLRGMVATAVASLALCHQTSAFVAPFVKLSTSSADGSSSTTTRVTTRTGTRTGATRMSAAYAPQNVQAAWDNHLAAFGGKDVSCFVHLFVPWEECNIFIVAAVLDSSSTISPRPIRKVPGSMTPKPVNLLTKESPEPFRLRSLHRATVE